MVKAFSNMSQSDLSKPATETVDEFVAEFNVPEQQRSEMKRLYSAYLKDMQHYEEAPLSLKEVKSFSVEVLSPREQKQRELSESIDRLNEKFFLTIQVSNFM